MSQPIDENNEARLIRGEEWRGTTDKRLASMEASIEQLKQMVSGIGRPNYMLWISIVGVLITMFTVATGGLLYFMKSEITTQVTPVALKAASSETDRQAVNLKADRNAERLEELARAVNGNALSEKEKGIERETQNRAMAQFQNMRHAQYMQIFGVLWQREFNQTLPVTSYFPDISFSRPHGN